MKARVYDTSGKHSGDVELPPLFSSAVRRDVIMRAVLSQQANRRQAYGSDPLAGKRTSAHYHGSRHYRYSMMNKETSRMPRIHGRVGYMAMRARFAPQAVKGRRAHPPVAEKIWSQKINAKEKMLAIRSALAATANIELVKEKHRAESSPIVVADDFENVNKTKTIAQLLETIIPKEMLRVSERKIRAGRGKMRGRRYRAKKGPVIVVAKKCAAIRAARNMQGVDVADANSINAEMLAPGGVPGRLLVVTKSALHALQEKYGE
jgi:large subunit ribosomal protein L4e